VLSKAAANTSATTFQPMTATLPIQCATAIGEYHGLIAAQPSHRIPMRNSANTVATIPKAMSAKPNCFALVCISITSGVWGLLAHCAENQQKLDILTILIGS